MHILYSLAFSFVAIFNHIELSLASSSPEEIDFISRLDRRSEAGSHQESSSHPHSTGERLPETELRLNTNSATHMHFYMDPQNPSATPNIPTQFHDQVPVYAQKIPLTWLPLKKTQFYFTSGFQYSKPEEYQQGSDGKLIPKTYRAIQITPGNHQVEINQYDEAVSFQYAKGRCSLIIYQSYAVALRWEHGKLGVRILEESERKHVKTLEAYLFRRNPVRV